MSKLIIVSFAALILTAGSINYSFSTPLPGGDVGVVFDGVLSKDLLFRPEWGQGWFQPNREYSMHITGGWKWKGRGKAPLIIYTGSQIIIPGRKPVFLIGTKLKNAVTNDELRLPMIRPYPNTGLTSTLVHLAELPEGVKKPTGFYNKMNASIKFYLTLITETKVRLGHLFFKSIEFMRF